MRPIFSPRRRFAQIGEACASWLYNGLMKKGEIAFYAVTGLGVLAFEISNLYGLGVCLAPVITLIICYIGLRYFPPKS